MNIVIDIGNTFSKLALFEHGRISKLVQQTKFNNQQLAEILDTTGGIKHGIVSLVGKDDEDIIKFLSEKLDILISLDNNTPLPIKNLYKTKSTLGNDRLAAAVGAYLLFPGYNVLVIDAGTAITYEYINSHGHYLGGGISPGLNLRYRSLNDHTARLPLLQASDKFKLPANNTREAIVSGIQTGIIKEIDGIINDFKAQFKVHKVVLSGGDAIFFETKLKNSIFVDSNLVLKGLNRILEFNV